MKLNCFLFSLIVILLLAGCVFFAPSPHENFIGHLNLAIGKDIDTIPPFWLPHEGDLLDSKILPNGNIENRYQYRGTCKYYYEINTKSRKIVAARFEGKDSDCSINP